MVLRAFLTSLLMAAPARAADVQVAAVIAAADAADAELDLVEAQLRTGARLFAREDAHRTYADAVFAAATGDHEAAALGFFVLRELTDDPSLRVECEWTLAESLWLAGHESLADPALEAIIANPRHPWRVDAAALLLRLYAEHYPPTRFAPLVERLEAAGLPFRDDTLRYAVGRSWFLLRRFDAAEAALTAVSPGAADALRARYVLGAIQVARGQLADAELTFREVVASASSAADRDVVDQAQLALGRIAFERGDAVAAATALAAIGGDSPVLDQAMVEQAWAFMRAGDLGAAARALELFRLRFPESALAGEAQLLRAHVLAKAGDRRAADEAYTEVDTQFVRYEASLRALSAAEWSTAMVVPTSRAGAPGWIWAEASADPIGRGSSALVPELTAASDDIEAGLHLADLLDDALSGRATLLRHQRIRGDVFRILGHLADQLLETATWNLSADRSERREARARLKALRDQLAAMRAANALTSGRTDVETPLIALVDAASALVASTTPADEAVDAPAADARRRLQDERARAERALDAIRAEELAARAPLISRLHEEQATLLALRADASDLGGRAEAVAARAAEAGRDAALARLDVAIRDARAGLADLAWAELTEISEELAATNTERSERLEALERLFAQVRSRQGY